MAITWSEDINTPAAAITLVSASTSQSENPEVTGTQLPQPILFATQKLNGQPSAWVIENVSVTLVRNWNISTARIILSCDLQDETDPTLSNPIQTPYGNLVFPRLPDVSPYRGGNDKQLGADDEIRIYAGYVESPLEVIDASTLTEIPFNIDDSEGIIGNAIEEIDLNPNGKLAPIFWGFIDQIELDVPEKGGIRLILSCRDRMRAIADTRALQVNQAVPDINNAGRDEVIYSLFRTANGSLSLADDNICWRSIERGLTARGFGYDRQGQLRPEEIAINNQAITDPSIWLRLATHSPALRSANPRTHIWVERPPLTKKYFKTTFQIFDKTPLDVLNHLALTEERPIDVFASHINGDYIFGPRVIDTSGTRDPQRQYRTYFLRTTPQGQAIPPNQRIIESRILSTTLGTYNRFFVVEPRSNGSTSSSLRDVRLFLDVLPYGFQNRWVSPPCRTMIIKDASIRDYQVEEAGAALVALSTARNVARDISGIQFTILGDPTFYPSEAVRVWNTLLHDSDRVIVADQTQEEGALQDLKTRIDGLGRQLKQERAIDEEGNIQSNEQLRQEINGFLNSGTNSGRDLTSLEGVNPVLPVYKVRTVQHVISAKGSNKGFRTTLEAIVDF